MTLDQLNRLKESYASGILKIREGDTWVEYNSMKEMRIAIQEAEREMSSVAPKGTRLTKTSNGY
jgi:hypothetical protein